MSITKNSELGLLYNSKEMEEQIALFDLQSGCDQDHAEVNYSDLYKYTDEMEAFLKEKGVGPGKRVVLAARNSLSLVAMLLAIWRLRALAIPVDFRITAKELSNIFHRVEADLLVKSDILVMEDLEEKLAEKRELLFSLEGIAKKGSSNSRQASLQPEDIDDDVELDMFGLDSLAFMELLTGIEKDVGYIPQAILEGDLYPETFGELVSAYDTDRSL